MRPLGSITTRAGRTTSLTNPLYFTYTFLVISRVKLRYADSVLAKSFRLISPIDRRKTILSTLIQVISGVLDLIGVAMIGALGALTIAGLNSKGPGNRLNSALKFMGLENFSYQDQIKIVGCAATLMLLSKTLFSAIYSKKTIKFLSRVSSEKSALLLKTILQSSYLEITSTNSKEISFAIRWGMRATIVGIVGAISTLVTDALLSILLFFGLFIVDPIICISALIIFGVIGTSLYWNLNHKARHLGTKEARLSIKIDQEVSELLGSLKDLMVRQRIEHYFTKTRNTLNEISTYQAEQAFLPLFSKYVIESGIVVATIFIIGLEFFTQDASRAIATTTVFFAAASRIAPAVLRMQQSLVAIKGNIGVAATTISLFEKFQGTRTNILVESNFSDSHPNFTGEIKLEKVSYFYPGNSEASIKQLDFQVKQGEFIGITGVSGAGKTTLVNLMLGLIQPTNGSITLSGKTPGLATRESPGAVAYVPQDIFISDATIRENIALGFESSTVSNEVIEEAIKKASLEKFIRNHKDGINFQAGENGNKLSGGEKQRIGIARALITKPKILILDEATSSLDGVTEAEISNAIENLAGDTTIIVIAHRLSTIKNASRVLFLKDGTKVAEGRFEVLRNSNLDFRVLCEHMGL